MPPLIALFLWFVLLLALLCFDPAKVRETSGALWIPVTWMFFAGSRLPSQWLGAITGQYLAVNLEDGNPLDRTINLVLIGLAIAILVSRSFAWGSFFKRNFALMLFIIFALLSVFWSDLPLVAFKRWFRDLGNYFMVLVVLSDPRPLDAVRTVFRRLAYLFIPLSILVDKYFPTISKMYDQYSGVGMYVGVATGKNLLGLVALLSGVFFFWDTRVLWANKREPRTKRIILLNLAFLAMCGSLLITANSATCKVCMLIGCLVVIAVQSKWGVRHPGFLKVLIPGIFCLYLILTLALGMGGDMAAAVGKDPTLTDRTKIWAMVLGMHTNPLIGTGYESFWMGPRMQWIWDNAGLGPLNESHNGYIEVYLNLGIIGLLLIAAIVIDSYRKICKLLAPFSSLASLSMALWTIMLFYCVAEVGFRSGLMWLAFLLVAISVKHRDRVPVTVPTMQNVSAAGQFPRQAPSFGHAIGHNTAAKPFRGAATETMGFQRSNPSLARRQR
ncbi:MAG: O-antigen ligase family protein [Candidatus Acidiferrales bacterium]|jgi:exopolysaccharide production protein ExoQ